MSAGHILLVAQSAQPFDRAEIAGNVINKPCGYDLYAVAFVFFFGDQNAVFCHNNLFQNKM